MKINRPLHELSRPSALADVVGQSKAVALASAYVARGMVGGKAFWITGPSGSGKTTIARILADSIADSFSTIEIDAAELTADYVRELPSAMSYFGIGRGGRAWIINEAHGLRADTVRRLLVLLESLPAHVTMIFTTTNDGHEKLFDDVDDAGPLLSRCVPIALTSQGLCDAFSARAVTIAAGVGVTLEVGDAAKICKRCKNNMRAVIGEIEGMAMLAGGGVAAAAG